MVSRQLPVNRRGAAAAVTALVAILLWSCPVAASPIVFSHTAQSPVVSTRASQDQTGGSGIEFQTFDLFQLAGATSIDGIGWQGSYFNPLVSDGTNNPAANATGFVVQFYEDSGGGPGMLLASQTFSPAAANQTFVGQQAFPPPGGTIGLAIYDYSVIWAGAPFLALGGTPYWLSIYAVSPPSSPSQAQWGWNGGTGGDGLAFQKVDGTGAAVTHDRALSLNGVPEAVPEPASLVLLGTGLAALALRRRRR